uniref:Slit-like protein n=1 Tax=Parasteatoda tepidariorum TaxID=114398 RepID=A0A2L2YFB2_PARTP
MHNFPLLQNIHTIQCLRNLTGLELLEIEIKDSYLKNQLQGIFSPKLETLSVSGERLRSISSSAFAGMLSPAIDIELTQTSVDTFNDKIFIPLPLSSKVKFSIPNNKIQRLNSDMLSILDNKQVNLQLHGVELNPLKCDCNMQILWQWLQDKSQVSFNLNQGYMALKDLKCFEPQHLKNKFIRSLKLTDLTCDNTPKSTDIFFDTTSELNTISVPMIIEDQEHPLVIFEPPITKKPFSYVPASGTRSTLTKVDTMIIGIVAGVVAFVCILIIIICIIRLRRAHPLYTAGPLAGPLAFRAQGKCTCLKPPPNNCTCYPMHPHNNGGRPSLLPNYPHKLPPGFLAATGQSGRLRNTPYYVTYPDSDNENK